MTKTAGLLAAALAALFTVCPERAGANAFVAWTVAGVPWNDTLNVRKFPSNTSRKRAAYPNGTRLSMTGRCTGGVNLREMEGLPAARQKRAVRNQWCEVWHDPAGNGGFESGWVYGRYISPAF